jgi:glucan phosphoethanolaminetransferase (alkaline phosphatase superfamily)
VIDAVFGGFATHLSTSSVIGMLVLAALFHAAFGVLVALAFGAILNWAHKRGAKWVAGHGLVWGRLRVSHQRVLLLIGLWVMMLLSGFTHLCLGAFPFGYAYLHLFAVVGPIACLVLAVGVGLAQVSRAARLFLWALFLVGVYWLQARLIYQFSKSPPLSHIHALGLVHMYVLALLGLATEGVRWWRPSKRVVAALVVAATLFLAGSRPLLSLFSNEARVLVYQRTSLAYRLLWLLPDLNHDISPEERQAMCSAPPVNVPAEFTPESPSARGVVMIFIDSLRADRVGSRAADGTPLTPRISEFAARASDFSRAYTTAPSTRRALRSMVTGKFNAGPGDDLAGGGSLGYVLKDTGIQSVAVSAHKNLRYSLHMFDTYRQFEREVSNRSSVTSETSTRNAIEELEKIGSEDPFFMLVHYYDPHAHYVPNAMFDFGGSEIERYDAEVAYTDHWVGKLFDELEGNPRYKDVAVILVGDHGDEFWEHRFRRHLISTYDEAMRVPLIVKMPGNSGQVFDTPVSVADLFPTILQVFALDAPATTAGRSLFGAVTRQSAPPERPIHMISYYEDSVAVVTGDKKVIRNRQTGANEFYNLALDPLEKNNLADDEVDEFQDAYCGLLEWMETQTFVD